MTVLSPFLLTTSFFSGSPFPLAPLPLALSPAPLVNQLCNKLPWLGW